MNGKKLQELRESLGWSKVELAEYWGLNRMTVSEYENKGDEPISNKGMYRILLRDLELQKKKEQVNCLLESAAAYIASERGIYEQMATRRGEDIEGDELIQKLDKMTDDLRDLAKLLGVGDD